MKKFFFVFLILSFSLAGLAQSKKIQSERPMFTYDVGAASGSYNGQSYSEVNFGINWNFLDELAWRNSLFSRFGNGVDAASGVDSSFRYTVHSDPRSTVGLGFYLGGGYRFTKTPDAGPFGETGLTVRAGGINVGVGAKAFYYPSPGTDSNGNILPHQDTSVSLILSGGGSF